MKKISFVIVLSAVMALFTSCGDNFLQGLFESVSGKASTMLGDGQKAEYTSSIVMYGDIDTIHYALGLSMSIELETLLNMQNAEDIQFPFLFYRVVDNDFNDSTSYTVNNILTNEDLVDFDYTSLLEGEYAENHLVGVAVSPSLFYVMSTGTINIDKASKSKLEGSFSGSAYEINIDSIPMMSEELVPLSGTFSSRVSEMLAWLLQLQENGIEERAAVCAR